MRVRFVILCVTAACAGHPHAGPAAVIMPTMTGGGPPDASSYGSAVQEGYARVRAATARFRVLDSAVAAGFSANVPECFVDSLHTPPHGAMGYHHVNRANVDKVVDIEKPEILLYERHADGTYTLNGVEYLVPFRLWPRDSVAPGLLGREMYRDLERNYWYMHMWVWTRNPAGLFADWNPAVRCLSRPGDFPRDYRSWTHVRSRFIGPGHARFAAAGGFQHTYANAGAMIGFRTRNFPDGAVIVVDWLSLRDSGDVWVEGPRRQVDVMTKDARLFAATDGWEFRRFAGDSRTELAATPRPDECLACHRRLGTTELVVGQPRP